MILQRSWTLVSAKQPSWTPKHLTYIFVMPMLLVPIQIIITVCSPTFISRHLLTSITFVPSTQVTIAVLLDVLPIYVRITEFPLTTTCFLLRVTTPLLYL